MVVDSHQTRTLPTTPRPTTIVPKTLSPELNGTEHISVCSVEPEEVLRFNGGVEDA
jgi:hypothetical protein